MGSKMAKSYSPEFREQIIKECMETNKYTVVAKKASSSGYNSLYIDKKR